MEGEKTQKFQIREGIPIPVLLFPTPFLILFLFLRIYQIYPVGLLLEILLPYCKPIPQGDPFNYIAFNKESGNAQA